MADKVFPTRSSKKRRTVLYDSDDSTPGYSSPDDRGELNASTRDISIPDRTNATPRRASETFNNRSTNLDELEDTYYREADSSHSRSREHSLDRSSRSSTPGSVGSSRASDENSDGLKPPLPPVKVRRVCYKEQMILNGHERGVSQVRFSPDGQWIASCSADATIIIWEASTGKQLQTLEGHLAGVSTIAWSPDSKTIASGSDDKTIRLWDRATGKPYLDPLLGHSNYVFSVAFSPKGNMLVSGSYDEAVFLWDVRARRQMRNLPAHSDPVGGVDFIRDGTLIVSCATDGLIRIWDTATGQCLRTIVHEDNAPVVSVQFSPNGKYVLAWTLDGCIRLWDYVEGLCKKTFQGHVNKKHSIGGAFGVYGKDAFVVSGSEDGDVIIWDVNSKNILQVLEGHESEVLWADTHPTLELIATCGMDNTVRIWANEEEEEDVVEKGEEVQEVEEVEEVQKAEEGDKDDLEDVKDKEDLTMEDSNAVEEEDEEEVEEVDQILDYDTLEKELDSPQRDAE